MDPLLRWIFLLAFVASMLLSSLLGSTAGADGYDELARGLLHSGTLSFAPDPAPTVLRMPLYPLFLAATMELGGERFLLLVSIFQALFHACTSVCAALICLEFAAKRAALITGLLCALHPLLLWYSSKLLVESLSALIFTALVLLVVRYWRAPSVLKACGVGIGLGAGLWCKASYVPLLAAIPLMVLISIRMKTGAGHIAAIVGIALVAISPWLIRNYQLTGHWPLFQALLGYNLTVSDAFVENAAASPFSYAALIGRTDRSGLEQAGLRGDSLHARAWVEWERDDALIRRSLNRYSTEPLFFVKKILLNSIWFWILASSREASALFALLQGALLLFTASAIGRGIRIHSWSSVYWVPVWMSVAFLVPHVLVFALARFSIILIPSLVAFAAAAHARRTAQSALT